MHHYVDQREALQAPAPNSKAELQALGLKAAAAAEARGAEAPNRAHQANGNRAHQANGNGNRADERVRQLQFWKPAPTLHMVMSAKILVDVNARPVDVTVFAAICSYGGSAGRSGRRWSWPSIRAIIARSAGLKRRAVISSIKRLELLGHIDRIVGGGRGRSTLYSFD